MIYGLIFTHWVADFICQSDWMAKNKSKSNEALFVHIMAYSSTLMFLTGVIGIACGYGDDSCRPLIYFTLVNGAAHFIIDYFTSRYNSKMWAAGKVHEFFVGVGFDQALHMATLYGTYQWLLAR